MNREEFINWLDRETDFERQYSTSDTYWKRLVDYYSYDFDVLDVADNSVVLEWWEGGSEFKEQRYTFEEFIENYKNYILK